MTRTEQIAHRILDSQSGEVASLGCFAALAELDAEDCSITIGERRELLERAERYRNLQLAALSNL